MAIGEAGAASMMTLPELAADSLEEFLGDYMRRRWGSSQGHVVEIVTTAARMAMECIGTSDALYHNIEHTMLVTLAGRLSAVPAASAAPPGRAAAREAHHVAAGLFGCLIDAVPCRPFQALSGSAHR